MFKKKVYSLIVTMFLSFSLMLTFVSADEVVTSLPDDVNGVITLESDVKLNEKYVVETNEELVVDLNGYEIDASLVDYAFKVDGKLTLKGTGNFIGRAVYVWGGNLEIATNANITATKRVIGAYNGSTVLVNENAILTTTGSDATILIMGAQNNGGGSYAFSENGKPGTLTVYGKVNNLGGYYAISGNGTDSEVGANITLEKTAEVYSEEGEAIYLPNKGDFIVNGAKVIGGTAIYIRSGNIIINDGTFLANGEAKTYDPSTLASLGHALVIDSQNYPGGNPNIKILGGSFISENNTAIGVYAGNSSITPVTNFIYNGLFSSILDASYFNSDVGNEMVRHFDGLYAVGNHDNLKVVEAKEETCIHEGNIKYYVCEHGYYYYDEEAQNPIENVDDVIIKPNGIHTYGNWNIVTEATTEKEGIKEKTCAICGHKITESIPKEVTSENEISNPNTLDNSLFYIFLCLSSVTCVSFISVYFSKSRKQN